MNMMMRNWDAARLIRLVIGAGFALFGLYSSDYFTVMMGVLLAMLALLNWSCCAGGCNTSAGTKAVYKKFVVPYPLNDNRNNKK